MKTHLKFLGPTSTRFNRGLTISEMMISMAIFSMVVLAMVYAHMFGLMQNQLVESKIGASDESRKGLGNLAHDVRSAKYHTIGNWNAGTFYGLPNGTNQVGNAIQMNLTTNTAISITYFFDTNTPGNYKLCRFHTGDASSTVIASHLTNNVANGLLFVAEDHQGNIITDVSNRRIIHFILGFSEYQYPLTQVANGRLYDRYKIEFRLTPHVPEGR